MSGIKYESDGIAATGSDLVGKLADGAPHLGLPEFCTAVTSNPAEPKKSAMARTSWAGFGSSATAW